MTKGGGKRGTKEKSQTELKEFGVVMTTALVVIAAILWWQGKRLTVYLLGAALVFYLFSVYAPLWLRRPERAWMALAEKIGFVMSHLIVTLTFFFAVTPLGLFLRLIGKDLLLLKWDPTTKSYWSPVEKDGPSVRYFKPY